MLIKCSFDKVPEWKFGMNEIHTVFNNIDCISCAYFIEVFSLVSKHLSDLKIKYMQLIYQPLTILQASFLIAMYRINGICFNPIFKKFVSKITMQVYYIRIGCNKIREYALHKYKL